MNVLLTSVGRRSYLCEYFCNVLQGQGRVIAVNSIPDTPGMLAADGAYTVPPAVGIDFIEKVLGICQNESISLLCSLHDWEAPIIAANIARFNVAGVIPVVSAPKVIEICLDKYTTALFCMKNGIRFPNSWLTVKEARAAVKRGIATYPLIIKPRRGQGSIELYAVETGEELSVLHSLASNRVRRFSSDPLVESDESSNILIQQMIIGQEYGLDVVNDLDGHYVACFVKRKLAMRAGETDVAETVDSPELETFGRKIGESLRHVGVLDVDVMVDDTGPCLLEMNPRFGGGYPFSHEAGANIPAALVAWAKGLVPDPSWLKVRAGVRCCKDVRMLRLGA